MKTFFTELCSFRHRGPVGILAATVLLAASVGGCAGSSGGAGSANGSSAASAASTSASSSSTPRVTSAPLWPAPGTGALPAATATALQKALDTWRTGHKIVGASVAVVTSKGVWSGASGVDGAGVAVTPTSAMAIASITKTFVAAEVMLLSGRGRVNLDAPLTTYLTVPFDTKGATVRQVLAMSSGFPGEPQEKMLPAVTADLHREWTVQDVLALVDPKSPREGTLGGPATYNSLNYVLLGQLIEKVTGSPLAQVLRRDLIEPAGLARVWTQTGEQPQPPLTVAVQETARVLVDPAGPYLPSRSWATAVLGGGTMAADAPSLARWGYLLYGGHVIDSSLVAQMTKGSTGEWGYGLGTMTAEIDGQHVVGHAGDMNVYTSLMLVWGGGNPATVSVLVPAPQVGDDLKPELAVTLQQIVQSAGTA